MKILHIIPSLDYSGAAAQLGLLCKYFSHSHEMHICCLGGHGVWAGRLRQHGKPVVCLNWSRVFDPTPPWKLHRLLKEVRPDVINAWRPSALRALGLVGRRWLERTLVSRPLPGRAEQLGPFDRWLLRRVRTVAAASDAEAILCREAGVREQQLVVVSPGIEAVAVRRDNHEAAKSVVCVGPLESRKGFREAIWTFDMLHFAYGDTKLKIVGDGRQRPDLQRFVTALQMTTYVDFLGRRDDVSQLLCDALACWIPTREGTGRQVALDAMAAGCPVIATDRPCLRELIADGRTGFLVPAGDKVAVSKRTRGLLLDANLRHAIGAAGREHVMEHYSPEHFAERCLELYAAAA